MPRRIRFVLDLVDKQILRSLQLNPRAPFSRVAAGLDCSEQTVARRYRRLVQAGAVRVIAAVDPRALGESDWVVRVRTRPESTLDVGHALCRRDDVAWVSVGAASEVVCAVRSHTARDREGLLVHRLPRSAAVLDVSASVILRHFVGGSASDWVGLGEFLTPEQELAIGVSERAPRCRRRCCRARSGRLRDARCPRRATDVPATDSWPARPA